METLCKNVISSYCATPSSKDWDLQSVWSALQEFYPISISIDDIIQEVEGSRELITQSMLINGID